MAVTAGERRAFEETGILVKRGLLREQTVAAVRGSYEGIGDLDPEGKDEFFYYEPSLVEPGRKILRRIECVTDHSSQARDLILSDEIQRALHALIGEPALLFKDKLNLKLPGASGFRPHIDGHFYWTDRDGNKRRGWAEYADYFINVVVPLDSSTVENGCLEVSPLGEALELFGRSWEEVTAKLHGPSPDVLEPDIPKLSLQPIEVEPGDVIFFDWRNPHASKENLSDVSRRIFYATYNRASRGEQRTRYYADKRTSQGPKDRKALL